MASWDNRGEWPNPNVIEFVDQGAEIGKAGNTFTFELVFPIHGLDDLADNLRQPTQGVGFGKRKRIGVVKDTGSMAYER